MDIYVFFVIENMSKYVKYKDDRYLYGYLIRTMDMCSRSLKNISKYVKYKDDRDLYLVI
jgi:hypothetical protein